MGNLREWVPGSIITPPTSTRRPRVAGISATPTSPVPAVISTAGTAITSIKTGPPVVTMTTEAEVVMTTGATAETTKTIGGDGTEVAR